MIRGRWIRSPFKHHVLLILVLGLSLNLYPGSLNHSNIPSGLHIRVYFYINLYFMSVTPRLVFLEFFILLIFGEEEL
jgi:hypothetical protein